jgi:hypothetical protein
MVPSIASAALQKSAYRVVAASDIGATPGTGLMFRLRLPALTGRTPPCGAVTGCTLLVFGRPRGTYAG